MSKKVIVVGAGPGGLATSLRLQGQGFDVELFESGDRVGGRMRGFQDGDYAFDTGPTILQLPRLYDDLFASAGLKREDYITFTRLEPYTKLRFWDDSTLELTTNFEKLKHQLAAFRNDLPAAFERWYAEETKKYDAGYEPYLSQPARSILGYMRLDELGTGLKFRPWETLYQHFWNAFKDERLVYALSYPAKYLGMHPTLSASVFSLIPYIEMAFGVWHPQGGFRALAQAIAQGFQDKGGKIHLNTAVKQVWLENRQVQGVELENGEQIKADTVILTTPTPKGSGIQIA